MICPGCEFTNAPGASRCARCSASLANVSSQPAGPRSVPVGRGAAARMQPIIRPDAATAVSDSGENPAPDVSSSLQPLAATDSPSQPQYYSSADAATLISPSPLAASERASREPRGGPQNSSPESQLSAASAMRTPGGATSMADSPTSAPPAPSRSGLLWTPDFGPRYEVLRMLGPV